MKNQLLLAGILLTSIISSFAAAEYQEKAATMTYLINMPKRPWWNGSYRKRLPLLLSEPVGKDRTIATVDFTITDKPEMSLNGIRVIDATGQEVSSQIEKDGQGFRIVFQTSLRPYQQKPFLVYYDYQGLAAAESAPNAAGLTLDTMEQYLSINNDKIEVEFWRETQRRGKINKIRLKSTDSPNELSVLTSGGAWFGHSISTDLLFHSDTCAPAQAEIISDGALKKSLRYSTDDYILTYSVYKNSNRIDYELTANGKSAIHSRTAWLVNGSSNLDKLYYESVNGIKELDGERNEILDSSEFYPKYSLKKWMKEGWLAIEDKEGRVTAGNFFDNETATRCDYYGQGINGGQNITVSMNGNPAIRGALIALAGGWQEFRDAYIEWKNPPQINQGETQNYVDIKNKVPDYLKQVTRGYKVEIHPLRDARFHDDNSAANLIDEVLKYGANSIKLTIQRRYVFPMPQQQLELTSDDFKRDYERQKNYVKSICSAAHSNGMAVRYWYHGNMAKTWTNSPPLDEKQILQDLADRLELAKAGVDHIYLTTGGEFHGLKPFSGYGTEELRRELWFNQCTKFLYEKIKEKAPDIPVGILCSGSGTLNRYVDIESKAPWLDTLETELVVPAKPILSDLKYGVKYPIGAFGNDGRALQHHFYFYKPDAAYLVGDMELPMIFGLKSFCCESMSNRMNNTELIEIVADFYRFIDYTGLENFIAGAQSVDYLGVIRDRDAFVNDIETDKIRYMPDQIAETDFRCKHIVSMKNMPVDVVVNQYATAQAMGRYKAVFLPSNSVLGDKLAAELLGYVDNGGCLITEGESINNRILAAAAGIEKSTQGNFKTAKLVMTDGSGTFAGRCFAPVKASGKGANVIGVDDQNMPALFLRNHGKGKIVFSNYILSDDLARSREKAEFVRAVIEKLVQAPPVTVPSSYAHILDSNLLKDGERYMLGVYNSSQSKEINCSIKVAVPLRESQYVLDLKNAHRAKFTGEVEVLIPPGQTGMFLIGDDAFTQLPKTIELSMNGGCALKSGMAFHNLGQSYQFKIPLPEEPQVIGIFKPEREKNSKSGTQNYGYEAIFTCLSDAGLKNTEIKYLHSLSRESLDGCKIVIVSNIGLQRPKNLPADWVQTVREFVKQGGAAMLMHHAVTLFNPFPEVGSGSGVYNPAKTIKITASHPVTKGLQIGDTFQDTCWDYKELEIGEAGEVFLQGMPERDSPAPVGMAGQVGKGKVVLFGIGVGAGIKKVGTQTEKFEVPPTGNLKQILVNAVDWMTH